MKIEFVSGIDDMIRINAHGNKPTCNKNMLEINPAVGCQFKCQYCNAYTQGQDVDFSSVKVYTDYPQYLESYLEENEDKLQRNFLFFT